MIRSWLTDIDWAMDSYGVSYIWPVGTPGLRWTVYRVHTWEQNSPHGILQVPAGATVQLTY